MRIDWRHYEQIHHVDEIELEIATSRRKKAVVNVATARMLDWRGEELHPSLGPGGVDGQGRKIGSNSISAVIRLLIGKEPIALLPGDLDEIGLDDLMESHDDIRAPLLLYPHHGGRSRRGDASAFARRLCELVRPETVVFSIGRGRVGTPRPEVVGAIRQFNTQIRIACTQLSKRCAVKVPKFDPDHLNPEFSGGRETRSCCAGTLVLDLDALRALLPTYEEHLEFIRRAAPLALCQKPTHLDAETAR